MAPAGLLTDLDGTLAPIVAIPGEARVVAGAVESLETLAGRLAVVGVITGRAAGEARRILGDPRSLLIVGNHGLEWIEPGSGSPANDPSLASARAVVAAGLALVPTGDAITVEDKGLSATVHYRGAADPPAARDSILRALAATRASGLDLREGRMSVELRPAGMGDKGTAVRRILARFRLRGLVVAGDDVTDLDMFEAAHEVGAGGDLRVSVLAIAGGREVPPEVTAAADIVLGTPADFARFLRRLVETIAVPGVPRSDAEPAR